MFLLSTLIHFIAASAMALLGNWIGLLPWRQAAQAHWTERARLLWPARVTAISNVFIIPFVLDQAHRLISPATVGVWQLTALSAFFGVLLGSYPFDRTVLPKLNFARWWRQAVGSWGFRLGTWIALIAAAMLMPTELTWRTLVVVVVYVALHLVIQYGLLLRYLRWLKLLTPANERLKRIVTDASARAGIAVRAVWMLESAQALAFAFPTTNEMLFTEPLLDICDDDELSTISAHEIAHLSESRWTLAGRLLGSLNMLPFIFLSPMIHLMGIAGLLVLGVAFLAFNRFAQWLSQRMERRADQTALLQQVNQGVYAGALERLYMQNQLPAVNVDDRQTHPHLYDRLIAAGITPDYPRPAKPKKMTWIGSGYCGALGILIVLVLLRDVLGEM